MKKRLLIIILLALALLGCNKKEEIKEPKETNNTTQGERKMDNNDNIRITIDNKEYSIKLEDNATVRDLKKLLPLNITMEELNGNEKYIFLSDKLSTNETTPKRIEAGDVMLYGNNCIVIFYKSFDSKGYSYTKLGHIDNLEDLGKGSVKVKITE